MGSTHTQEYVDMLARKEISLYRGVVYQLRYNHFPPIPFSMVEPCIRAIKKARKGEWDKRVRLPEGILFQRKWKTAPVYNVIESHHLMEFVEG